MSTQANSSLVQVASMAEAAWSVIPGTVVLKNKRVTGETLAYDKGTVQSAEIRSDRQIPDLVEVYGGANGGINFELSFGAHDDWLLGLLLATDTDWTTPFDYTAPGAAGNAQFTAPSTIAASGATFTPLRVGQFIRVTGATNSVNNGIFTIATVAATTLTIVETTLTNENSSHARIRGSMIRNGNTVTGRSFLLEKSFPDIVDFVAFPGMYLDQLTITAAAEKILTGAATWIGQKALPSATTLDTAGGYDAATTADVLNATSNVGSVKMAGTALGTALQEVTVVVNNNLRKRSAIGQKFTIGVGTGTCVVTGRVTAYFEDLVLYNHLINHDAVALQFRVTDAAGNTMIFTLPKTRFSKGDPQATAINQDVMLPLDYQAVLDPTSLATIQIDKLAA